MVVCQKVFAPVHRRSSLYDRSGLFARDKAVQKLVAFASRSDGCAPIPTFSRPGRARQTAATARRDR